MKKTWILILITFLYIGVLFFITDRLMDFKISERAVEENLNIYHKSYDIAKSNHAFANRYEYDNFINKDEISNHEIEHFQETEKERERVNFLLLGVEGGLRTDTIIFVSFDIETKKLYMISIPRDTYFYEKGYERGDQRKINARYGRSKEKGSIRAIEKILGVPIHHYVSMDYKSVEEIVDIIGGVEVNAPCDMVVDDIEISEGKQILNGEQAIDFVRFREKYQNGDLERIKVQQQFIKSAFKKIFGLNLPKVIKKSFKYIKTDMALKDILYFSLKARSVKIDEISMKVLPGIPKYKEVGGKWWSYYFYDLQKVKELMKDIYNVRYTNERRTEKLMVE